MKFNDLNRDVIFEIFLHFVATDWDGPYTLILVSTRWRDLVLSKPRLWTWIMVDDSQVDWKHRVEVALALTRDLPLQLVLRIPFLDTEGLLNSVPRCQSVFLQTSRYIDSVSRDLQPKPSQASPYGLFGQNEHPDADESVTLALSTLSGRTVETFLEDIEDFRFSRMASTVYAGLTRGKSLGQLLEPIPLPMVTSLVFRSHAKSKRVDIQEIWLYLPSLPNLIHLELGDDFLGLADVLSLNRISLPSLLSLVIFHSTADENIYNSKRMSTYPEDELMDDSYSEDEIMDDANPYMYGQNIDYPTESSKLATSADTTNKNQSFPYSAVEQDIFGLLDYLNVQNIRSMDLRGSITELVTIVGKLDKAIGPSDVTLRISEVEDVATDSTLDQKPLWRGLDQLTVNFPIFDRSGLSRQQERSIVTATRSLLLRLPDGCSVQLVGEVVLEALWRQNVTPAGDLDIIYSPIDHYRTNRKTFPPDPDSRSQFHGHRTRSLTLSKEPPDWVHAAWTRLTGHVTIKEGHYHLLDQLLTHSGPTMITQLDCNNLSVCEWHLYFTESGRANPLTLKKLTTLRCPPRVAEIILSHFDTPQLQAITLTEGYPGDPSEREERGALKSLTDLLLHDYNSHRRLGTFGIEWVPAWSHLRHFLSNFNRREDGGISILKLPCFPHPAILQLLVKALVPDSPSTETSTLSGDDEDYRRSMDYDQIIELRCLFCFRSGQSCYEGEMCSRSSTSNMVSITKDTFVDKAHSDFERLVYPLLPLLACIPLVERFRDLDSSSRFVVAPEYLGNATSEVIRNAIWAAVPQLIEQLKDESWKVRSAAASALAVLSKYAELHGALGAAIPRFIELLKDEDFNVRSAASSALAGMAKEVGLRDAVGAAIPQLIEMLKDDEIKNDEIKDDELNFQYYAPSALVVEQVELRDAIGAAIPQLIEMLKDKDSRSVAISILKRLVEYAQLRDAVNVAIPLLVDLLKDENFDIRHKAFHVLDKLAECSACYQMDYVCEAELHGALEVTISPLVELLEDKCFENRDVISTLNKLAEYTELHGALGAALSRLLKGEESNVTFSAGSLLLRISENECRAAIPHLIEMLKDSNSRYAAARAIQRMAEKEECCDAVGAAVPWLIELIENEAFEGEYAASSALTKIAEHAKYRGTLGTGIPRLIELLNHEDSGVRGRAVSTLGMLTKYKELCAVVGAAIPRLIELLKGEGSSHAASSALAEMAGHAELCGAAGAAIPQLIEMLKDTDFNIRSAAAFALARMAKQVELRDKASVAIPQLIEMLEDDFPGNTCNALEEMATQEELRDAVGAAIPRLIGKLIKEDYHVRSDVASALARMARHAEFRDTVGAAVLGLIEMLKSNNSDVRSTASSALGSLAECKELRDIVGTAIPWLIEMLRDEESHVRYATCYALEEMAKQMELCGAVGAAIPQLIEMLSDEEFNLRSDAVSALAKMAERVELHDAIGVAIPRLVEMLKNKNSDVRSTATSALKRLTECKELRDAFSPAIPGLINLLNNKDFDAPPLMSSVLHALTGDDELGLVAQAALDNLCNAYV